jgi:hypothetical protein
MFLLRLKCDEADGARAQGVKQRREGMVGPEGVRTFSLRVASGSRLIDRQSQNKTVAARAMAERKTVMDLS